MNIQQAAEECKRSGLNGIQLIEFAQRLVCSKMEYSYTNSFDLPGRAFERGGGYCWQQASVLNRMLRKLGFDSRLVYATRNIFPEKRYRGVIVRRHTSGHVWCRVRFEGRDGDVCPGDMDNRFGKVHFQPASRIRSWNVFVCFFSYWGSAVVNLKRYAEIEKQGKRK